MTAQDFMRQAIAVAEANSRHPFGVITVDGDTNSVIAEGGNQSRHHPMWHGEIVAINHGVASVPKVDLSK